MEILVFSVAFKLDNDKFSPRVKLGSKHVTLCGQIWQDVKPFCKCCFGMTLYQRSPDKEIETGNTSNK